MPEPQPPRDVRREFLENRLAFSHDPFAHAVAEQELAHQSEHFFAYVDTGEEQLGAILATLEEPRHTVVFGAPGTGKTTLRLNLARNLAKYKPHILSITYEPSHLETPGEDFEAYLVGEIAKDLLLILLRQSGSFEPWPINSADPAVKLVAQLLRRPNFERSMKLVQQFTSVADGQVLTDQAGEYFAASLGRRTAPPEVASAGLRSAAQALLNLKTIGDYHATLDDVWKAMDSHRLETMFILVDGLDLTEHSTSEMVSMLEHFWEMAARAPRRLWLKLFLPAELGEPVRLRLERLDQTFDVLNLAWSPAQLLAALLRRVRAARSDMRTVNDVYDLFEPGRGAQVVEEMIEAAQGSPRRLFQLFSAMIDAHLPANATETGLTYSEWQESRRRVALT